MFDAAYLIGTAAYWEPGGDRLITGQDFINAGIPISNLPDGIDPSHVYIHVYAEIEADIRRRVEERGGTMDTMRIFVKDLTITEHTDPGTCPCGNPSGWDACPVHRDGDPTTPRP